MKRRALLGLLATSGCQGGGASRSFSRQLLELAKNAARVSDAEISGSVAELAHLGEMASEAVRTTPSQPPVAVVTELLFGRLGFAREVNDQSLDFALLPSVLGRRRGSCVGLGTLLLALAETLGWSASGVLMPGHFYVRVATGAEHRNVELLRQ
ncbi:MAG TPA: transglutaminase family protein, partial [Polyangiaceae bacterium]|nr:transglutaminase family protein [Polyangiaceae bacterium]